MNIVLIASKLHIFMNIVLFAYQLRFIKHYALVK